jgi:HPt (histidine-containing phosphotransfer) domain-containing protein
MRAAGIEKVVELAVEAFMKEAPGRMAALEFAVRAHDWVAVEKEAHGLKSGSMSIRAEEMGRILAEMEAAGREGQGDEVLVRLPALRQAFREVMAFLRSSASE